MTTLRPKNICQSCQHIRSNTTLSTCAATGGAVALPASHCVYYDGPDKPVDAVILTAVPVELHAVLDHFTDGGRTDWSHESFGEHSARWWLLKMTVPGHPNVQLRVACGKATKMGLAAAAALTTTAAHLFRPRFLVMAGITAGRRGHTKTGDIVVSDNVFDYGSGKWIEEAQSEAGVLNTNAKFCPRPEPVALEYGVRSLCDAFDAETNLFEDIRIQWLSRSKTRVAVQDAPKLIVGPTASGAAVVDSEDYWRELIERNQKVVSIDMEAFGVAYAAEAVKTTLYRPSWLVAKSVCDFGVAKNDDHQPYAAYTSVRFVREFLIKAIIDLSKNAPVISNVA